MGIEENGILGVRLDRNLIIRLETAGKRLSPQKFNHLLTHFIHQTDVLMFREFDEMGLKERVLPSHFKTIKIPVLHKSIAETKEISDTHNYVQVNVKDNKLIAEYTRAITDFCSALERGEFDEEMDTG